MKTYKKLIEGLQIDEVIQPSKKVGDTWYNESTEDLYHNIKRSEWLLTSLSGREAIKKYGKKNVRIGHLRMNDPNRISVEIHRDAKAIKEDIQIDEKIEGSTISDVKKMINNGWELNFGLLTPGSTIELIKGKQSITVYLRN